LEEGTDGADFLAFLALGLTGEGLSPRPCVGGCLEDNFVFAMDFLRAERVGSEGGSAGTMPSLTTGVLGEPYLPGVISGSLRGDSFGEETIFSITGEDCLEDPLFLRDFWVP